MRNVLAISIEVLIGSRNFDTALPTARTEIIMCARIVEYATVNSQVIIVEAWIHRTFSSTYPHTIFILAQYRTSTTTQTEADDNRLGIRSYHAETGIALAVNLRIFLSRLIHRIGNKVLLGFSIIKSSIEVLDSIIGLLGLIVLVERQRMVIHTQPRVAVTKVPESHTVDDILVLAENLEDTVVLIGQQGVHIASHGLCLTTREAQLSTHLRVHTNIELCNMDVLHEL